MRSSFPTAVDLLVVSPTFYPEPIGTPVYATDAARWFRDQGFKVAIVTAMPFYPRFQRYPGYGQTRRWDNVEGLPTLRLPTLVPFRGMPGLRAFSDVNFFFQGLLRLGQLPRPRAVLSFSPGVPLAVGLGNVLSRGARHVGMVHDVQTELLPATSRTTVGVTASARFLERWLLERCNGLHTLSPEMGASLKRLGVRRAIDVTPIWVELGSAPQPAPSHDGRALRVMYSGNLGRKQDAGSLVAMAARLASADLAVEVIIQGEGPARSKMERAAKERRLRNLTFRPLVPRERLQASLLEGDLHVVPQASQVADAVLPSKIFNIMAVGRPAVVASAEGSALASLAARSGALELVPSSDADAMAEAVLRLARDRERLAAMGEAGQRYVSDHHSRDAILGSLACSLGLR